MGGTVPPHIRKPTLLYNYERVILLKDAMNTVQGKRMAEFRHNYIKTYVDEIRNELNAMR